MKKTFAFMLLMLMSGGAGATEPTFANVRVGPHGVVTVGKNNGVIHQNNGIIGYDNVVGNNVVSDDHGIFCSDCDFHEGKETWQYGVVQQVPNITYFEDLVAVERIPFELNVKTETGTKFNVQMKVYYGGKLCGPLHIKVNDVMALDLVAGKCIPQ